jgi:hypothetical protein
MSRSNRARFWLIKWQTHRHCYNNKHTIKNQTNLKDVKIGRIELTIPIIIFIMKHTGCLKVIVFRIRGLVGDILLTK